jgi:cobalamin-dependent methionine synthase I
MADALVEALCDLAEREICAGLKTRPRFSPGYGDLELSLGEELVALTDADKLLRIRMTESGLMVPKKSVNALIVIKDE